MGIVPDAGDNPDLQGRNERGAVRSWRGLQDCPGFQRARIDEGQAGAAAVRDQDATIARNDAGGSRKSLQRRKVPVGIGIDNLKTVPSRVRNESAPRLGFKSTMVER